MKYKVEFEKTIKYIVDVSADNESKAVEQAESELQRAMNLDTEHYYEEGETTLQTVCVYDVTNTDDPFSKEVTS